MAFLKLERKINRGCYPLNINVDDISSFGVSAEGQYWVEMQSGTVYCLTEESYYWLTEESYKKLDKHEQ